MSDVTRPDRDLTKLHPLLRIRLLDLFQELGRRKLAVFVTEGWRSGERQAWLYEAGRTRPGPVLTYAKPGQSHHNLTIEGVPLSAAADVAVWDEDEPWPSSLEWNGTAEEWKIVHEAAAAVGLETLNFERPHLQLPFHTHDLANRSGWPSRWPDPAHYARTLQEAVASR